MTEFEKNIINFHRQLTTNNIKFSHGEKLMEQKPDAVIIAGMGGSGLAGRILKNIAFQLKLSLPIKIWSDYDLPPHSYKNPFFIFVSFSGNTVETLSALAKTPKKSLRAVITTGGEIKKIAEKNKLPLAVFPAGTLQPRQATGFAFYALLGLLKFVFPHLRIINLEKTFKPGENRSIAEKLAGQLAKKYIMIYTSVNNSHLAYNWKDRLNETGKRLAFFNVIPEMCHNEIVSFESRPENWICLFLTDPADHPENKKRVKIVSQLLKSLNIESININLSGKNIFEKIFQSINLADWLAYYLAKQNNFDPAEIKIIDQLKNLMA